MATFQDARTNDNDPDDERLSGLFGLTDSATHCNNGVYVFLRRSERK